MSLDAVTIVGLVLGILGLWGLPTLWKRVLYASKVPRQRAKINARITHLLDSLHDRTSGNFRGVDGFEARVEDIERRYRECYTEMTFAYSALQWLMWIVWCFRADPYLRKLFALHEELTSLLERIRDRNDLGNIVTTAVTTTERDHTCTSLSIIMSTVISIIGLIKNFPVLQLYNRANADQNACSSNPLLPRVPNTDTLHPPTTKPEQSDCANSSRASAAAVSDHSSYTSTWHCENHVTKKPDGNQNQPSPVLPAPAILPTPCSPFAGRHSPNIRNGAESLILRPPAANTDLYLPLADGRPFPSESKPSMALSNLPCHPDARGPEHRQSVYATTALRVLNNCDRGGDGLSSITNYLPVKPAHHATIGAGEAPVVPRELPRMTISASTATAPPGQSAAGDLLSLPSPNRQNGKRGDATLSEPWSIWNPSIAAQILPTSDTDNDMEKLPRKRRGSGVMEVLDDRELQPTADGVSRSFTSVNDEVAKRAAQRCAEMAAEIVLAVTGHPKAPAGSPWVRAKL